MQFVRAPTLWINSGERSNTVMPIRKLDLGRPSLEADSRPFVVLAAVSSKRIGGTQRSRFVIALVVIPEFVGHNTTLMGTNSRTNSS